MSDKAIKGLRHVNYDYIVPFEILSFDLNYHMNTYFNETLRCDTGVMHYITSESME